MFVKCTSYSDLTKYLTKLIVNIRCKCHVLKKRWKVITNIQNNDHLQIFYFAFLILKAD